MRFLVKLVCGLFLFFTLVVPSQAQNRSEDGWISFGARHAALLQSDRDAIQVGREFGGIEALRLQALGGDVYLSEVVVTYAGGRSETIAVRKRMRGDGDPVTIEFRGRPRDIETVEMVYRGMLSLRGLPSVELSGYTRDRNARRQRNARRNDRDELPRGWIVIGEQTVGARATDDVIKVGRSVGRLTAIQIQVFDNDVEIEDLDVEFGNGRARDIRVRDVFKAGTRSREIDLGGGDDGQYVRQINIAYQTARRRGGPARVLVLGQLSDRALAVNRVPRRDTSQNGNRDDRADRNRNNRRRQGDKALWVRGFGLSNGGWRADQNLRTMADVNGDGRDDVVGFGNDGVYVALAENGGFSRPELWVRGYGPRSGGWQVVNNPRYVIDVNGDRKADIVGFSNDGVYVSLARNGRFSEPELWVRAYGLNNGGWQASSNPRYVTDVNGDGRADVVAISNDGVFVSLARNGRFSEPELWVRAFGVNNGGWQVGNNPRIMADVNGDGKSDIVGFSNDGVLVSLARNGRFSDPELWVRGYGLNNGGWQASSNPRYVADVNGDGRADIIGFSNDGVFVSLARNGRFSDPENWVRAYGVNNGGWQIASNPRYVSDIDGDGKADIIGISNDGVFVSLSNGRRFDEPELWIREYGVNNGGWQVANNPRFMADVNGDKKADLVGFANDGVYVTESNW